ncbi:MAG: hypothetical protein JRM89_04025 [Nitrososphaerota archaeon]|nr:hypothetical protein [Nitrososphaerota archaeon]MDG7015142.1 hypothetical protein [Nitrososphaerota archaeon]
MDEKETVALKIELPKRAYDFIRNEAKSLNKTVEEYIDVCIQESIAGTLIAITMGDRRLHPDELAVDLGLDTYISEGKKLYVDYSMPRPRKHPPIGP